MLKKLFFSYQRLFWYVGQAKTEYGKFGSFIPETLTILTYLSVKNVEVKAWHIPIAYIFLLLIAGLIGKVIAWLGITKYNNTLNNDHNKEILEILERLKRIEEKMK